MEVAAVSSGGDRESIVSFPSNAMPSAEGGTVDLRTGHYGALSNVRAQSGDVFWYHVASKQTKALWVVEQHKSCANIRLGIRPDPKSSGVLFTKKVRDELSKISDEQHLGFYDKDELILVIITNKPLSKYKAGMVNCVFGTIYLTIFFLGKGVGSTWATVNTNIANGITKGADTIPPGVLIVSNETFTQYVLPAFCHSALWLPMSSEEAEEVEKEEKEEVVPMVMLLFI